MTDEKSKTWFTEQPAGQPVEPPAAAPVPQAPATEPAPQVSGPADFQAALQQAVDLFGQKLDERERREQSRRARTENRIRELEGSIVKALNKAGIQLTPEQAQAVRSEAITQAQAEDKEPPAGPGSPQPAGQPVESAQPTAEMTPDWRIQMANETLKKAGVELIAGDPEAAVLLRTVRESSDPEAILTAAREAAQNKAARLSNTARVGTPSVGGGSIPGNPYANITDPGQLIKIGLNKRK